MGNATQKGRKMLTCPKCNEDMYPVCSNKNCVCHKKIPSGKIPMRSFGSLFGRIKFYNYGFLWDLFLLFKQNPSRFIFEGEECPYCGFGASPDYWEDRNMEQTFYEKSSGLQSQK